MAELQHATEQPGYASAAWRAYCDTLAAKVKELGFRLNLAHSQAAADYCTIQDYEAKVGTVMAQRDELIDNLRIANGMILEICDHCGISRPGATLKRISISIAKIEAEKVR